MFFSNVFVFTDTELSRTEVYFLKVIVFAFIYINNMIFDIPKGGRKIHHTFLHYIYSEDKWYCHSNILFPSTSSRLILLHLFGIS